MRLIDADALSKEIVESIRVAEEWKKEATEKNDKHGQKCAIDTRRSLFAMLFRLKEQPTIEAEPVRHGKWLPHKITVSSKCNICRRVFADETQFCPNCGADMREGGANNGNG